MEEEHSEPAKGFAIEAIKEKMEDEDAEVDFFNKIIISHKLFNTNAYCVIKEIIQQRGFARDILKAITNDNSELQLKFLPYDLSSAVQARAKEPSDGSNVIEIRINEDNLNHDALQLASDIIHEIVHAQLIRIRASNNSTHYNLSQSEYNSYLETIEYFEGRYERRNRVIANADHEHMAEYFVIPIAEACWEFDDKYQTLDHYMMYGWEGLETPGKMLGLLTDAQESRYNILQNITKTDNHITTCD